MCMCREINMDIYIYIYIICVCACIYREDENLWGHFTEAGERHEKTKTDSLKF